MALQRCPIIERKKGHPIHIVRPNHFEVGPGVAIAAEEVVSNPNITLYCVDADQNRVLFVECPDEIRLEKSVFYYQGQFENATSVIYMPLPEFHRLAEDIQLPKNLIFVHSVGRCGSTLVSKALDAVPSVLSLSEPDDLTQICESRTVDGSHDAWLRQMIVSSVHWRAKARHEGTFETLAIKTRSEVLVLGDLIYELFTGAHHPFLYRNAVSWMRSNYRSFPMDRDVYDHEKNREMVASWAKLLPLARSYTQKEPPLNPVEVRVLAWISCVEAYLDLLEAGAKPFAIRYEDLNQNPKACLEAFFQFCDVEVTDWPAIENVLGKDSQEGSFFSRSERYAKTNELTESLVQDIDNLIATRPRIKSPHAILPGTYELPSA